MTYLTKLPTHLPLFPLRGAILLPGLRLPLNVFEPRYLNMVDDVRADGGMIGIIQTRNSGNASQPALADIGGAGKLVAFRETSDGRYLIELEGVSRFRLVGESDAPTPYRIGKPDFAAFAGDLDPDASHAPVEAERGRLVQLLTAWLGAEGVRVEPGLLQRTELTLLVDELAMQAPFAAADRQRLLEAANAPARVAVMQDIVAGYLVRIGHPGPTGPN
ncbi:LON peptidase substrate-binding domain-containing protein [Maricaulis sp. CAU 1757]